MPDGVVQWFDRATGEAAVIRGKHVFRASAAELEPVARRAGARVHFDIRRDHGVERAVDVTLRQGTRVSHHQHSFGTLVGARRPDTKGTAPFAGPHPELGLSLASHPLEVARAWARCLQAGDLEAALLLYAPDATLHRAGQTVSGRSHLQSHLEASPLLGTGRDPEIRGEDGVVLLRWTEADGPGRSTEVRCRVEHGQLAEQWFDDTMAEGRTIGVQRAAAKLVMSVLTHGDVDDDALAYAVDRIGAVTDEIGEPVLFARVKLTRAADPARARPALAQVALDVNGEMVRAHVAAHVMREAIDLLQQRLRNKLEHRAEHRRAERRHSGVPEPGEWRHADLPTTRPDHYERPIETRQLLRHKTFAVDELTPDEAAFDMGQLDFDFHLFRDLASGEDAVIERLSGHSYRLMRLHPTGVDAGATALPLEIAELPAPELSVAEAIERLDASAERFVFFANATTGRGNVVYRRYDGHYGLLTLE